MKYHLLSITALFIPASIDVLYLFCLPGAHHLFLLRYWRYNEEMRTMDPGYPKPITVWRGVPESPQGAFVDKANGTNCPVQYSYLAITAQFMCQAALISAGYWHTLCRSKTRVALIEICPSYYTEN